MSQGSPTPRPVGAREAQRPNGLWARWWLALVGVLLLIPPGWNLATRWAAVTASQPDLLVSLLVFAVVGVALIVLAVVRRRPRPAGRARRVGRVLAALVVLVLSGALVWVRPFPAAPAAVRASASDSSISVATTSDTITMTPTGTAPTTGLAFYPGARVDPRAYAGLLRPIAERGYLVVIVKERFNLAVLSINAPAAVVRAHLQITHWATGGHSLGGTIAATYAGSHRTQIGGLLLWASYPASSLAGDTGLAVTSISGSKDGLATPAKIASSKPNLPPSTTYVVIHGAAHADFGDYGVQPGGGTPSIPRASAAQQIIAASTRLLKALDTRR